MGERLERDEVILGIEDEFDPLEDDFLDEAEQDGDGAPWQRQGRAIMRMRHRTRWTTALLMSAFKTCSLACADKTQSCTASCAFASHPARWLT